LNTVALTSLERVDAAAAEAALKKAEQKPAPGDSTK